MRNWLGLAVLMGVVSVGCGGSSGSGGTNNPPPPSNPVRDAGTSGATITIVSGFTFSPSELTVDAGTQIVVMNSDSSSPHSVTSEAADNAFTKGSVAGVSFDTGVLNPPSSGGTNGPYGPTPAGPGGSAVISIPAGTPSGTVIPFFCTVHTSMMSPPNGHITVH